MPPYAGRAEEGHFVEVLTGEHVGKRGVVSRRPFRVRFADGAVSGVLREADFAPTLGQPPCWPSDTSSHDKRPRPAARG